MKKKTKSPLEKNISVSAILELISETPPGTEVIDILTTLLNWNKESKQRKDEAKAKRESAKTSAQATIKPQPEEIPAAISFDEAAGPDMTITTQLIPVELFCSAAQQIVDNIESQRAEYTNDLLGAALSAKSVRQLDRIKTSTQALSDLDARAGGVHELVRALNIDLKTRSILDPTALKPEDFSYSGRYSAIYEEWLEEEKYPNDDDTWHFFINQMFEIKNQPTEVRRDIERKIKEWTF